MIITDLSQYPRRHRRASVADMAMGLGTSAEALAPMLDMLERKGRIPQAARRQQLRQQKLLQMRPRHGCPL